ncbi:MAG: fibro-slime domain-containing protein [Phycisphaera sp.]|nr:fibro-slime domain-containing protein [Phycisphaera sp.]
MLSRKCTPLIAFASVAMVGVANADTLQLTGTIRDFKRGDWSGGHPDFETAHLPGRGGYGLVLGLVSPVLGQDGNPVYNLTRPSKDTMSGAENFNMWYNDVAGVNVSAPMTLTLDNGQTGPGGVYTYSSNAFWPIDGQMFGNQSLNHNFHFTFQLATDFTYKPGQKFTFIGDDDVWVYINSKQVIDLGGVHSAVTGSVLLFDGKAFVSKSNFSVGGNVQSVSSSMNTDLKSKWAKLNLGTTPDFSTYYYVDLGILATGTAEINPTFTSTSVNIRCTQSITSVVIAFTDATEQKFDSLSGTNLTLSGTGAYEGKTIVGVWVKTGSSAADSKGAYFSADGSGLSDCTLDFFFAERHTTQSNFRIDTSMHLKAKPPKTITPLYD